MVRNEKQNEKKYEDGEVPYILQYYFSMKMLQLYTFRILIVPVIVTFFFCFGTWAQHDSAPLLCGCLTRIRKAKKSRFQWKFAGQTEATPWHSSNSGHLSPLWFPSSRRYLAAQAPPVLPLVYLSWVNSQYHLEDWWDPFNKKDFFQQKEQGKNQHCSGKHFLKLIRLL